MNRLDTIAIAQKRGRLRDALFACFVVLATTLAITSATTAVGAGVTTSVAQR